MGMLGAVWGNLGSLFVWGEGGIIVIVIFITFCRNLGTIVECYY